MGNTAEQLYHLRRLADELRRREWPAAITGGQAPCLRVANPVTPELNERVVCWTEQDGEMYFLWSGRQRIGPVADLGTVVGQITHVLRTVEGPPPAGDPAGEEA